MHSKQTLLLAEDMYNNTIIFTAMGVPVTPFNDPCMTEGATMLHDNCVDKPTPGGCGRLRGSKGCVSKCEHARHSEGRHTLLTGVLQRAGVTETGRSEGSMPNCSKRVGCTLQPRPGAGLVLWQGRLTDR